MMQNYLEKRLKEEHEMRYSCLSSVIVRLRVVFRKAVVGD